MLKTLAQAFREITGINLNLSASVGFIALFGIAVLNGVVMVSHINRLRDTGLPTQEAVCEVRDVPLVSAAE